MKSAKEASAQTEAFRSTDPFRDLEAYLFQLDVNIEKAVAEGLWGSGVDAPERLHPAIIKHAEAAGYYATSSHGTRFRGSRVSIFWSEGPQAIKAEKKPEPKKKWFGRFT